MHIRLSFRTLWFNFLFLYSVLHFIITSTLLHVGCHHRHSFKWEFSLIFCSTRLQKTERGKMRNTVKVVRCMYKIKILTVYVSSDFNVCIRTNQHNIRRTMMVFVWIGMRTVFSLELWMPFWISILFHICTFRCVKYITHGFVMVKCTNLHQMKNIWKEINAILKLSTYFYSEIFLHTKQSKKELETNYPVSTIPHVSLRVFDSLAFILLRT